MIKFWWDVWALMLFGMPIQARQEPGLEVVYRSKNVVFVRRPVAHRNSA
jgi:hypothetical protein